MSVFYIRFCLSFLLVLLSRAFHSGFSLCFLGLKCSYKRRLMNVWLFRWAIDGERSSGEKWRTKLGVICFSPLDDIDSAVILLFAFLSS